MVVYWESEEMQFLVHWNLIPQAGAARYIRGELELTELKQNKKLCFGEQEKPNFTCIWIPEFAENQKKYRFSNWNWNCHKQHQLDPCNFGK